MNLLIVVTNYPNAGHPFAGAFNERSARTLRALGHRVEVLAPRPYVPRALALLQARWRAYGQICEQETRDGVMICRPAYLQVPGTGGALWPDRCAYYACVRRIKEQHERERFDAILAFNLVVAGGLAWRLAMRLNIPAAGWATGNDVRVSAASAHGRAVRTALDRLDLMFYQSAELRERAGALLGVSKSALSAGRHVVLPRGVESAPAFSPTLRAAVRDRLGVRQDQLMVLFVGRLVKAKGVFELVDAVERARRHRRDIVCVMVGAQDSFDDSAELHERLAHSSELARFVQLLPACAPEMVWPYLNAADIFAFPSHGEGMPNSLLEAMAAGLPALAYAIPAVLEIDNQLGVLKMVPPRNVGAFADALVELAGSPELRRRLGSDGRARVESQFLVHATMAEAVRRLSSLGERRSAMRSSPVTAPIATAQTRGRTR